METGSVAQRLREFALRDVGVYILEMDLALAVRVEGALSDEPVHFDETNNYLFQKQVDSACRSSG